LNLLGLGRDRRLRQFLDLQLKLYSQVDAAETAVLYAATALGVSQAPQGLYHLHGSMQVLSDRLVEALANHGGELHLRHRVKEITHQDGRVKSVTVYDAKTKTVKTLSADQVVANVTTHNLMNLLDPLPERQTAPPAWIAPTSLLNWGQYRDRVQSLPPPSGAFVAYLGVNNGAIPPNCPTHLQFAYAPPPLASAPQEDAGFAQSPPPQGEGLRVRANSVKMPSLFVSVSRPGDGRAPEGCATIIASCFVDPEPWFAANTDEYTQKKAAYLEGAIAQLSAYFDLSPEMIVHQEAATPRTFAHYTARERGFVGGVSQRLDTFGPFGFGTRTPLDNLWLVGDSTHPGEGTAGVSYSALMAVRQIEQSEQ
jgi:C-3',4' desaturase CrtD